jgi:4-aminobutyrate aminotransferase-like enzyme
MLEKSDPIGTAEAVISGYHDVYPLERSELELLNRIIPSRWATNVCHTAEARSKGGSLEHKLIHEKRVQDMLRRWFTFNPLEIQNRFLTAAGFEPNDYQAQRTTVLKTRQKTTSPALGLTYESPLYIHSAAFQYMYDYDGNTYLDARNNIPQVGHSHPKVSEAVSRQVRMLNTNTRYLYDSMAAYSEKLLDHFPDKLCRIFYVNSGSAASDLAIRLARTFTARSGQLVLEHGYHGNTKISIDISSYKFDGKGGQGPAAFVTKLPLPKLFQGEFDNGEAFAQQALGIINNIAETPAAFIAEPISGRGGQVPLAAGYLKTLKPELERNKILTIIDEVQTGFGRLGQYFWGFEIHGIEPDIVVLGKPMGNGQPIAAVVTTTEISEAFDNGMEFFSSFGGNPVSTAAALAVLAVLEEEALPDNAQHIGNYIKEKLKFLAVDHPAIGDIRGAGLFLGVEFIDPETNSPATKLAAQVKKRLKDHLILAGSDGPANNVLKIKPPLCFNQGNADELCATLQKILEEQNA